MRTVKKDYKPYIDLSLMAGEFVSPFTLWSGARVVVLAINDGGQVNPVCRSEKEFEDDAANRACWRFGNVPTEQDRTTSKSR
jgi:hypothetical protein